METWIPDCACGTKTSQRPTVERCYDYLDGTLNHCTVCGRVYHDDYGNGQHERNGGCPVETLIRGRAARPARGPVA